MITFVVFALLLAFVQSEEFDADGVKWWITVNTSTAELHKQTKIFCDIFDHDHGIFNSTSSFSLNGNTLELTVTKFISPDSTKELALSVQFDEQKIHYNPEGIRELTTIKTSSLSMKVKVKNQKNQDLLYQNEKASSLNYEIFYQNIYNSSKELTLISSQLKLTIYFIGTIQWSNYYLYKLSWIKTTNSSHSLMSPETIILDKMFNSLQGKFRIVSYQYNSNWFKLMASDGSKSTFSKQIYLHFQYSQTSVLYKGGKNVNNLMQNATLYIKYQTRSDELSQQTMASVLNYSLQYVVSQKLIIRSKQLVLQLNFLSVWMDEQYGLFDLLKFLQLIFMILIIVQIIIAAETRTFQKQSKPVELLTITFTRALFIEIFYLLMVQAPFLELVMIFQVIISYFNSGLSVLIQIIQLPLQKSAKILTIAIVLSFDDNFQALLAVTAISIYLIVSERQIISRYTFREKMKRAGPTACIMVLLILMKIEKQVHSWTERYDYNEMLIPINIPTGTAWLIATNGLIYLLLLAKMEVKIAKICLFSYYAIKFRIKSRTKYSLKKARSDKNKSIS